MLYSDLQMVRHLGQIVNRQRGIYVEVDLVPAPGLSFLQINILFPVAEDKLLLEAVSVSSHNLLGDCSTSVLI